MKNRIALWALAALLVAGCLGFWLRTPRPIETIVDTVLRVTQPLVAITASYFDLPWVARWFMVRNGSKYVSCRYDFFGYEIAITTGCSSPLGSHSRFATQLPRLI